MHVAVSMRRKQLVVCGRYVIGAVVVLIVGAAATGARAEVAGRKFEREWSAVDSADTATLALPLPRVLGRPPAIDTVARLAGASAQAIDDRLAAIAVQDVRWYGLQLESLFPSNVSPYPDDSLRRIQRDRAAAWLSRLRALPAANQGLHCLTVADVAIRSEQDTVARRVLDACLANPRLTANERSRVLASAIVLFSDPSQDTLRAAANLAIAERYAQQLDAIPSTGYTTQHDSANVWIRKVRLRLRLFNAAAALRRHDLVLAGLPPFLAVLRRLPAQVRWDIVRNEIPYYLVATAVLRGPDGRAQLDRLNSQLLELVTPRDDEWASTVSSAQRQAQREQRQRFVREHVMDMFAFVGHEAPPILAHAWLNTPDSLFTDTARAHALSDGVVRVIAFSTSVSTELWRGLQRIQDRFAREGHGAVQVLYVTETIGAIGPDLATPSEEVAWLRSLVDTEHVSFPLAVWAGDKSVVNEYQWRQPAPSPNMNAYHAGMLPLGCCVLVDGRGIVRAYQSMETRREEVRLIREIDALRRGVGAQDVLP